MLYTPTHGNANNPTTHRATIRIKREMSGHKLGRRVAKASHSKAEAAIAAAADYKGGFWVQPTVKQWAKLYGVSPAMVHAALRLDHVEVEEVRDGLRPLIQTKTAKPLPVSAEISDAWAVAKGLVQEYGPALVFDTIISPTL